MHIPKDIFPRGNFSNVQFPKLQQPASTLATVLGPHLVLASAIGKFPPEILQIWEVSNGKVAPWEVVLVKMPLGKYLTPKK